MFWVTFRVFNTGKGDQNKSCTLHENRSAFLFERFTFFSKKGDSGGPLICGSKEKKKVYGVISWGLGCAKDVGIYARVAFHRDWIDKAIKVTRFYIHSI